MPQNAANRMTIPLDASPLHKRFYFQNNSRTAASGEITIDPEAKAALNVTVETTDVLLRRDFVFTGTPASGGVVLTLEGQNTTSVTTVTGTPGADATALRAALNALKAASKYSISAVFITGGFRVTIRPKDGTGPHSSGVSNPGRPFNASVYPKQSLTVTTNTVLDSGSAACPCTETDRTWSKVFSDEVCNFYGQNEVTQLTFASTPAGNFTVTVDGRTTGNVAYNSAASGATMATALQTAIDSLLGANNAVVVASSSTVLLIQWVGSFARRNVSVTASNPSTTGTTTVATLMDGAQPSSTLASVTVPRGGKKTFSFGNSLDQTAYGVSGANMIGPYFRVSADGVGTMEFSPSDKTCNIIRI